MKIGTYDVLGVLGRGGMGVVYRARSPAGEEVAVKVLLKPDAERIARFERERKLLGSFTARDGFVPLLEAGRSSKGPYLVMPLVPGGTLRERLARGPLGVEETIRLGRSLAFALARAHARGIVHRDLKPENVLFMADGRPLVSDLGLAKPFAPAEMGSAFRSMFRSLRPGARGTFGYMPVEQMKDARSAGPEADVFALGALLYECLAGKPAFEGESFVEILNNVASRKIEPLARVRPDAPGALVAAIERALEGDPANRFPDAAAFERTLARLLPGRAGRSRRLVAAGAGAGLLLLGLLLLVLLLEARVASRAPRPSPVPTANAPAPPVEGAQAALSRAREDLDTNDAAGAAREARELLRRSGLSPELEREAWLVLGCALLRDATSRDVDAREGARDAFGKLAAADPRGARGLLARAFLALLDERRGDAERLAEESLRSERLPETLVLLVRLFVASYEPESVVHQTFVEKQDPVARARGDERARAALDRAHEALKLRPGDSATLLAHALALTTVSDRSALVPGAWSERGNVYVSGELAEDLECAVVGARPDPAAITLRARALWLGGDYTGAMKALDRAAALRPPVETRLLRAMLLARAGGDPAPDADREVAERPRETFALARFFSYFPEGVKLASIVDEAHGRLLNDAGLAREHEAALAARLKRAAKEARPSLERAFELAREGRALAEMQPSIDAALAAAPRDPAVQAEAARLLLGRGEHAKALALLAEPPEPRAWLLRGEALLRRGDREAATTAFARAAGGTDAIAFLARAGVRRADGDARSARALAQEAYRLAPRDADVHAAFASALLEGPSVEADAAFAEAQRAVAIGGKVDAGVIFEEALALAFLAKEHPLCAGHRPRAEGICRDLDAFVPGVPWLRALEDRVR